MPRAFQAVLAEYIKAPEVTRKRIYLETMAEVLPEHRRTRRSSMTKVQGLLPLLGLGSGARVELGGGQR